MGDAIEFTNSKSKQPVQLGNMFKCEHPIEFRESDAQGKPIVYHKKCGKPAALRKITGMLTSATAVLCDEHAAHEDYKHRVSANGYEWGKIDKNAEIGYRQERGYDTGVHE